MEHKSKNQVITIIGFTWQQYCKYQYQLETRWIKKNFSMRKVSRKRFISVICCFVAVSLSFAPVAHAALVIFEGSPVQSIKNIQHNDKSIAALHDGSTHQHKEQMQSAVDCENGTTCEILCSASISVLHQDNLSVPGFENPNRWLSHDTLALKSSFLSRLDRPPRS